MTAQYSPMVQQYRKLKNQHQDEVLFFRLGDFYEMFFEDAEKISKELGLTLTSREGGNKTRIPMCGVPYHSADNYIAKLIDKGYKIAICEQVSDPKLSKGIVDRKVIKIITPGTVLTETLLKSNDSNFLVLLYEEDEILSLAATDISTGECIWSKYDSKRRISNICDELYHLMPAELVLVGNIENTGLLKDFLKQRISACTISNIKVDSTNEQEALFLPSRYFSQPQLPDDTASLKAVGFLLNYLQYNLKNQLSHLNRLTFYNNENHMILDSFTLRNLEITRNMKDGGKRGTLLEVMDHTKTAMGGRLLKKCLEYPLTKPEQILKRQDAVEEFLNKNSIRNNLRDLLNNIYDFERIMTRIELGAANARDLIALKNSLSVLPLIQEQIEHCESFLLKNIFINFNTHTNIVSRIENAIAEEPPISIRDGNIIKDGYDKQLDELRQISKNSKDWIRDLETRTREETGIKTLKVGYNKVFGYYIEITHANSKSVPDSYIRKQTLVNAERYITPELKEFETKILSAQTEIVNIEYDIFTKIREYIKEYLVEIQKTARQIAQLDILLSFSETAFRYNYIRPAINYNKEIHIKDGRHPVIERLSLNEIFVPNDTFLNHEDSEIMIITGPNMAGKSTYMRQVALICLLAHTGSFVPAKEASVCMTDRIFTRVGASDDLASGQSTFMVEMSELSQIIRLATSNSLIILDEIGRGTSTYDGMSIAKSVIEYIKDNIKAKTLFATHYHELTELENYNSIIQNYSVAVKERENEVIFLRRIIKGGADKSYGIYVAQLAGLPEKIITRATKILETLEECKDTSDYINNRSENKNLNNKIPPDDHSAIINKIAQLDVSTVTPLEALMILNDLKMQVDRKVN